MAPILPISLPSAIQPIALPSTTAAAQAGGSTFQQVLSSTLSHVANSSQAADNAVSNYLSGGNQELHSTILATQSASLDFELLLQVRNKVVSAYDEIMKMQI
jgi:flagellar hook-basal body complex protein FliE